MYLLSSKKGRFGLLWNLGSAVGAILALKSGIDPLVVGCYLIGGSLVVTGHMLAYGITDAAHGGKK